MSRAPDESIRVPHEDLRDFTARAGREAGLPEEKASTLATLLVRNDLRGVFSHGTRQLASYSDQGYVPMLRDGRLNADPDVDVVRETPVSVLVDGDGGLGFFPAREGTRRAIEKATDSGMAAMATRNHGHIGAAGHYVRQALEHDLLAFVTSGHQLDLSPDDSIYDAAGGSPMAFGAPADDEADVVLDFGTMHDLSPNSQHGDEIADLAPGLVLRHIGMGAICQSWGGLLAGLSIDGPRDYQEYPEANQGALAVLFRIDLFSDPDRFTREIDDYARQVAQLDPLDGFERAQLPGQPEAERERVYREQGIPVDADHRSDLETLADELGLEVPWE